MIAMDLKERIQTMGDTLDQGRPPGIGRMLSAEEGMRLLGFKSLTAFTRARRRYKIKGVREGGGANGGRCIYTQEQIEGLRRHLGQLDGSMGAKRR